MLSCEACVRDRVEAPLAYLPQDRTRQAYALPTADALERAYWRAGFWSKPGNRSSTEGVQAGRTASAGAPCGRRWAHSYEGRQALCSGPGPLRGPICSWQLPTYTARSCAGSKMRVPYTPERRALIPTREVWKVQAVCVVCLCVRERERGGEREREAERETFSFTAYQASLSFNIFNI